jgi:hypothetical protein
LPPDERPLPFTELFVEIRALAVDDVAAADDAPLEDIELYAVVGADAVVVRKTTTVEPCAGVDGLTIAADVVAGAVEVV